MTLGKTGDWLSAQRAAFESLVGCSVSAWQGVEMALRDDTSDGPGFSDPNIPFLQLVHVTAVISPERNRTIDTYQDDAAFGLRIGTDGVSAAQGWDGIYREMHLNLPLGVVRGVEVHFDEGTLAEVSLLIGEESVLLVAGEVYENRDGSLEVHRFDESVLAFRHPTDASSVNWMPPRAQRPGL